MSLAYDHDDPANDSPPEYTEAEWLAYERECREAAIDRTPCADGDDPQPFEAPSTPYGRGYTAPKVMR